MGDLNTVADVVMAAHEVIEEHGTPEMKAMVRMLLLAVGKEIAKCGGFTAEQQDRRSDALE